MSPFVHPSMGKRACQACGGGYIPARSADTNQKMDGGEGYGGGAGHHLEHQAFPRGFAVRPEFRCGLPGVSDLRAGGLHVFCRRLCQGRDHGEAAGIFLWDTGRGPAPGCPYFLKVVCPLLRGGHQRGGGHHRGADLVWSMGGVRGWNGPVRADRPAHLSPADHLGAGPGQVLSGEPGRLCGDYGLQRGADPPPHPLAPAVRGAPGGGGDLQDRRGGVLF